MGKILFSALDVSEPHPFSCLVTTFVPAIAPKDLSKNGVLILWGGGDISPSYYGQKPGRFTGADDRPSRRDLLEEALARRAIALGIPIIGICRGAQLLCCLSGGKLIQHVEGHIQSHDIETDDNRRISASSLHHQMMYPWDIEHKLIAWSKGKSPCYLGEDNEQLEFPPQAYDSGSLIEPEVIWFPGVKTLAIQGHPEFLGFNHPFVQFSLEQVVKLCLT